MQQKIRDLVTLKEDLRSKANLPEIIGRYVELRPNGKRMVGLCPFHADGNPSFAVFPRPDGKTEWGCWSCNERGDLYSFIQKVHFCDFIESVEIVAEEIGFDLKPYYRPLTEEEQALEATYQALGQLAGLFFEELKNSPANLHFFSERHLGIEILEKHQIGLCPSLEWLDAHVEEELLALVEPDPHNRRQVFSGNILFPQRTLDGRVWGWYCRHSDRSKGQPKYQATSRTSKLFDPSARLWGFSSARKLLRKAKTPLVIVEGFNDVLAAQQAGIPAVALCGSSLTADHIQTLHDNAVRKAIVVLDGDDAGRDGMRDLAARAHEIKGTNFKFALIPGDPDEFIASRGADAFSVVCEKASSSVEFLLNDYASSDLITPTAKQDFLDHVKPLLLQWDGLDRALGVDYVATLTGLASDLIDDYLGAAQENSLTSVFGELIILSEFAINPDAWTIYPEIQASHFYSKVNAQLFSLMLESYQHGRAINPEYLVTEAGNRGLGDHTITLIQSLPQRDRSNIAYYIKDVYDKALRRDAQAILRRSATSIADMSTEFTKSIGSAVEKVSGLVSSRGSRGIVTNYSAMRSAVNAFEAKMAMTEEIPGLDVGPDFKQLMGYTKGLQGGNVYLIAATSGVGKSVVGSNFLHGITFRENGPDAAGLIVSQEMTIVEQVNRLLSIHSGIPNDCFNYGRYFSEDQAILAESAWLDFQKARMHWMPEGQHTMPEIALQARLLKARGELDFIWLDYVQLLDLSCYPNNMARYEKYEAASQEMKDLSMALNVPIIAMAQLNRKALEEDVASGDQMGSAYKIYQDASMVLTLTRTDDSCSLIGFLDKNRGGAQKQTIKLIASMEPDLATLRVREAASTTLR